MCSECYEIDTQQSNQLDAASPSEESQDTNSSPNSLALNVRAALPAQTQTQTQTSNNSLERAREIGHVRQHEVAIVNRHHEDGIPTIKTRQQALKENSDSMTAVAESLDTVAETVGEMKAKLQATIAILREGRPESEVFRRRRSHRPQIEEPRGA
jgi:DNA repair ATPase RecN